MSFKKCPTRLSVMGTTRGTRRYCISHLFLRKRRNEVLEKMLKRTDSLIITVTVKAFFDVGHSFKDQRLNWRSRTSPLPDRLNTRWTRCHVAAAGLACLLDSSQRLLACLLSSRLQPLDQRRVFHLPISKCALAYACREASLLYGETVGHSF
jgi:hypothetical protein